MKTDKTGQDAYRAGQVGREQMKGAVVVMSLFTCWGVPGGGGERWMYKKRRIVMDGERVRVQCFQ